MKFQTTVFALVLILAFPAAAFMSDNIASPTGAACESRAGGKFVAQAKDRDWAAKGITYNDICCIDGQCLGGWTVFRLLNNGRSDEQEAITAFYSLDRRPGETGEDLCQRAQGTVIPEVDIVGTNPLVTPNNPQCQFQDQSSISTKTLLLGPKNPATKAFDEFIQKTRGIPSTADIEPVVVHSHKTRPRQSTTSQGGGFR